MRATVVLPVPGLPPKTMWRRELGRGQAGGLALGLNLEEVGERADFLFDVRQADEAVELGEGFGEELGGRLFLGGFGGLEFLGLLLFDAQRRSLKRPRRRGGSARVSP